MDSGYRREPHYRAYLIGSTNKIEKAISLDASSDSEAKALAREIVAGHAVEVWDQGRMVIRIEHDER